MNEVLKLTEICLARLSREVEIDHLTSTEDNSADRMHISLGAYLGLYTSFFGLAATQKNY